MCRTDKFDPADNRHRAIKYELMRCIALRDIATTDGVNRALEAAGFGLIEGIDRGVEESGPTRPRHSPMETPQMAPGSALFRSPLGRRVSIGASRLAELVGVLPRGSAGVVRFLDRTAGACAAGGRAGIFTPLCCFLARKRRQV